VNIRGRYMSTLRRYAKAKGRRKTILHRKASKLRRRLIAANAQEEMPRLEYAKDLPKRMPAQYKRMLTEALRTKGGRAALARYRKFTGLPWPTEIIAVETPGRGKRTLVGMGMTPNLVLADRQGGKSRKVRQKGIVTCSPNGRQIFVLTGRDSKAKKPRIRQIGYVAETHYVPTRLEESAGTFKRGRYWVHKHDDAGGRYPKAYKDQAGNVIYGKGTYKVTDWIRR
jgi:hypothetical protein